MCARYVRFGRSSTAVTTDPVRLYAIPNVVNYGASGVCVISEFLVCVAHGYLIHLQPKWQNRLTCGNQGPSALQRMAYRG